MVPPNLHPNSYPALGKHAPKIPLFFLELGKEAG